MRTCIAYKSTYLHQFTYRAHRNTGVRCSRRRRRADRHTAHRLEHNWTDTLAQTRLMTNRSALPEYVLRRNLTKYYRNTNARPASSVRVKTKCKHARTQFNRTKQIHDVIVRPHQIWQTHPSFHRHSARWPLSLWYHTQETLSPPIPSHITDFMYLYSCCAVFTHSCVSAYRRGTTVQTGQRHHETGHDKWSAISCFKLCPVYLLFFCCIQSMCIVVHDMCFIIYVYTYTYTHIHRMWDGSTTWGQPGHKMITWTYMWLALFEPTHTNTISLTIDICIEVNNV